MPRAICPLCGDVMWYSMVVCPRCWSITDGLTPGYYHDAPLETDYLSPEQVRELEERAEQRKAEAGERRKTAALKASKRDLARRLERIFDLAVESFTAWSEVSNRVDRIVETDLRHHESEIETAVMTWIRSVGAQLFGNSWAILAIANSDDNPNLDQLLAQDLGEIRRKSERLWAPFADGAAS